jgi:hypothetical protein
MSRKDPDQGQKLDAWKAGERAKAEVALPAPKEVLLELFAVLDERLATTPCDHSLRLTTAWADKAGIDRDKLAHWARENGGFCDCEVLANVEDTSGAF